MTRGRGGSGAEVSVNPLKYHLRVTFWDDYLSSHMGKPFDISGGDLLADRTSFMIFNLRIGTYTPHVCCL